MVRFRFGAGLAVCVLGAGLSPSRAATSPWVGDAHAAVRLIAAGPIRDGARTTEAGLQFRFAPGWHGYWRTPGDAGLPPVIDWSGTDNLDHAETRWPAPTRLVVEGLQNSVYEGTWVLPTTLTLKSPQVPSRLGVSVAYAACSKVCVPYQADLALDVANESLVSPEDDAALAAARAAVPTDPAAAGLDVVGITVAGTGPARTLTVDLRSRTEPFHHPDLFVEGAGSGLPAAPAVALGDEGRTVRLTTALPDAPATVAGLTLTVVDGDRAATFGRPPAMPAVPSATLAAPSAAPAAEPRGLGWVAALASALLGGLILNLMPCVLPVLSIKLLGLIRHAGSGRAAVRLGFAATAAGIVTCFLLLAAVLAGLKGAGVALGWGIQFQQPWFLAAMATLTVLFAASFFDWLPIGLPSTLMTAAGARRGGPLVEAFLTGAFATLLATPCSAPFVGTAVGFALAQGPVEIVGIFACLGLGMSLPYWVAAALPNAAALLPRPGRWMLVLRLILGGLLLGTALWLVSLLWSTVGAPPALLAGAALTLLLGLLAWRADRRRTDRRWPKVAAAALCLAPLGVGLLPASAPATPKSEAGWVAFAPDAVPGLVAQGKTVLVDVTATWCLTCKVNDLGALGTARVEQRLAQADTVRMRADWSRPDPAIAGYLGRFGRYGIPLDVVYGPARPDGEPLPELLTAGIVLDALDRASSAVPAP